MSLSAKGKKKKPITDEHRNKLSLAKIGKKQSIETIEKRNESRRLYYINKKKKNNGNTNDRTN